MVDNLFIGLVSRALAALIKSRFAIKITFFGVINKLTPEHIQ